MPLEPSNGYRAASSEDRAAWVRSVMLGSSENEATGVNDRTDADPDVVADRCSLQDDRTRCDVTGARCGEIQAPTGSPPMSRRPPYRRPIWGRVWRVGSRRARRHRG